MRHTPAKAYLPGAFVAAWVLGVTFSSLASAQESSPRALLESGKFEEAAGAVAALGEGASQADNYVAGQSLARLDRLDAARESFRKLEAGDENAWTFVGRSASAVVDGDFAAARENAQRAVDLDGGLFHAWYQLGIVKSLTGDFNGAAADLERATEIDGGQAYAHYYAGVAYNKARKVDEMARHFRAFVTLAPEAPERPQVEAILRTLRR
ncbi:MAG: hypothetical protein AB7I50_13065 [Vicinamibacterales bacterium]